MKIKILLILSMASMISVSTICTNQKPNRPHSPLGTILWSASWSHDDQYIAVGGDDGRLVIYETTHFKPYQTYTWTAPPSPMYNGIRIDTCWLCQAIHINLNGRTAWTGL